MADYPLPIRQLITEFAKLPGIGEKTAERFVFHLLAQPKANLAAFGQAVSHLRDRIRLCSVCGAYTENDPCSICRDPNRDAALLCIVSQSADVLAIEKTGEYKGRYHVLGGVLRPLEGVTPDDLRVAPLLERLKDESIDEVLIATNPDLEGEATALYLGKVCAPFNVRVTRLARGLPMGSDLEYADEVTLGNAIKGRRALNNSNGVTPA